MNPQLVQALMQTLQQAMQLIQQASGAPADPTQNPAADPTQNPAMATQGAGADASMDDEGDDESDFGADASMDDEGDDDEGDDMNGDTGGSAGSLHDRISKLEDHTGLKKSAGNVPVLQRLDALEMQWLGEEYEGPVVERVRQLEKAAGLTKAAATKRKTPKTATARNQPESDAPDVIQLDTLIKTAISEGVAQGLREIAKQQPQQAELPSVQTMRKNAQNGKPRYNQRRAQTQAVQADAELVKAAQAWGYDEDELDQPVGLGDVLLAQYHANQNGGGGYLPGAGEADDDN